MPIIPEYNADPKAVPFLRWARERIEALEQVSARGQQDVNNTNRGQSATLQTLGQNIVDLSGRVAASIAAATFDASRIISGVIDLARIPVIPQSQVSGTWDKAVATGSSGTFAAALNSAGAYLNDISLAPGPRQQVWQHNTGAYGFAPSSIVKKMNIGELPFGAAEILACSAFVYQYIGQVAIREDTMNAHYDPNYVVPTEVGLMAEHLIEHGLSVFVIFDLDGAPVTIDYALLGAVAAIVVGQSHSAQLMDQQRQINDLRLQYDAMASPA